MLALATAIFGFLAPFLPEVVKIGSRWIDNRHELEMMKLRLEQGAAEHLWRMEEITATADIAEARLLHRPVPSFGVQILDKASDSSWPAWTVLPVFWAFACLDLLAGLVRPVIAYAAFGFYAAVKWAYFLELTGPRFEATAAVALLQIWGEQDWAVLTMVLSYWFGHRAHKAAFGGNATSGTGRA